jgi:hypothetical protein
MASAIIKNAAGTTDITKGFIKRWTWRSFEPTLGNYVLATHEIASDLAWCQARGKKLIVMIEHRTFGYSDNQPAPDYLIPYTGETTAGGDQPAAGATIAIFDPYVVTRFKALLTAFAAAFGDHPALEGVMLEETSLGQPEAMWYAPSSVGKSWTAYTPEMYRDALIEIMAHWATVQPDVRWFFYLNYMAGNVSGTYLEAAALAADNCVICGPDAQELDGTLDTRTFWIYRDNNDVRPIMAHLSTRVYNTAVTGEDMYDFAVNDLGANYICSVFQGAAHTNWTTKIKPMVQAHPTFNPEDWT